VHYWQQAGDNAARQNAYPEVIAALRKGLVLLATLPETPERTQHELALQLYGWFTEGFDTPDLQGAKALLAELT
jgi:hypothetical protein